MTGLVLWTTSEHNRTDAVQLEYSYMKYNAVVKHRGEYDWSSVDKLLDAVAGAGTRRSCILLCLSGPGEHRSRLHQVSCRLPGDTRQEQGEGHSSATGRTRNRNASRWSSTRNSPSVTTNPRLAFVETGFGLWAEYHIYDGPMKLGKTFPDKQFQAEFAQHLIKAFKQTPWLISVDAADDARAAYAGNGDLLKLPFGTFDDSFLCKQHKKENEPNWNALGRDRWKRPCRG